MPIASSYKKMIKNFDKQYPKGKVRCYDASDGSKICAHSQAWSYFYAYLKKHGKKETVGMSKNFLKFLVEGLSNPEIVYHHALSHSEVEEIGDDACKEHFIIAIEMNRRGLYHATRSDCDVIVELTQKEPRTFDYDEREMLSSKWKACKVMLFRLSKGIPFESGVFKGLTLDEQKRAVKNLARKLKRAMLAKGCKFKKKKSSSTSMS